MQKGPELVFSILAICVTIMVIAAICVGADELIDFRAPSTPQQVQEEPQEEVQQPAQQELPVTSVNVCVDNHLYKYFYQGTTLISVVQVLEETKHNGRSGSKPIWCRY